VAPFLFVLQRFLNPIWLIAAGKSY
jgi:hypothetical protein